MHDEAITVRCLCGWETSGPKAAVVEATVEHGRRLHNMTTTRDEVLKMAVPRPDPEGSANLADPIRFAGKVRYWNPEKASGLAVIDIPADHLQSIGGLKQQRARGSLSGVAFASNVMPAGNGRLALSVSRAMMTASHLAVGDEADVEITGIGRD